jgi:hypothetical protein
VVKGSRSACLTQELLHLPLRGNEGSPRHLNRNMSLQLIVKGKEHAAEAPRAERALHPIPTDSLRYFNRTRI